MERSKQVKQNQPILKLMQRTLKNLVFVAGIGASVVAMTGCANTGGRSAGRYMDDRSITHKVENALEEDPVYKYPAVKVATYRGVTQLSGFVDTDEQKRRANEVVRTVMGPAEIINNIVVRPGQMTPAAREAAGTSTSGTGTSSGATGTGTTTDRGTVREDNTTVK